MLEILELNSFIRSVKKLMKKEEITELKLFLTANPEAGAVISHTGGLRKLRWSVRANQGKRGGARVIYYYHNEDDPLLLIFAYPKNKQTDLTEAQKKILATKVQEFFNNL